MDYDDILEELGELKKYQITTYILLCIPVLFSGAHSFSYVFTSGIPNYRCLVPECEASQTATFDAPWIKWAIPEKESNEVMNLNSNLCSRYVVNKARDETVSNDTCSEDLFTNEVETCNEWVFETERTIVNDWNLTCTENQWKLSFVATSHFAGNMVGSIISGVLADRYGRKQIFVHSIVLTGLTGCAQVLSPNFATFLILKFLNAVVLSGVFPLAFIICVEMVGKKKREIAGMVLNYFFALGEAFLALVAWYTESWVLLQLTISLPTILFIVYYWVIPESVRWLLANKRRREAKQIVCEAAKVNNVTLSESLLRSLKGSATEKSREKGGIKLSTTLRKLLKSQKLITTLLIIHFIWTVISFVYFGLSLTATSLSGNKYINFALAGLIEIPAYFISWISIQKIGRRWSLAASFFLCGLTCILTTVVPYDMSWAFAFLFLIGKSGATSAFAIAYVHTAELLPTVIRSAGINSASTFARFGALVAPFVPMLGVYGKPLPMLMFGGLALVAGILALKLSETLGSKLPETIDEAENM